MASANINVRIDADLKKQADELFKDLGLTMSSAISVFLTAAVNNNGIPFELKRETPNETTIAALNEYDEMRNNPDKYKRYDSFEDALNEVLTGA